MIKQLFPRFGLLVTAISALAFLGSGTPVSMALEGHPTSVIRVAPGQNDAAVEPAVGAMAWPTPNKRTFHLTSSCNAHAAAIRKGAAAWSGLTEGGGTPVECTNGYIQGCGGSNVVGCNWGRGQRITLFVRGVRDGALLAAHEFGHNWFGHSNARCAGWASAQQVMAPAICE